MGDAPAIGRRHSPSRTRVPSRRSGGGSRALPRTFTAAGALLLTVVTGACWGEAGPALQVERDTIGDTVVVRTVAGQAWESDARLEPEVRIGAFEGEDVYMLGDVRGIAVAPDGHVYVYDHQVPALRKYNADGEFQATLGREGGGPGEYRQSDGGMAVLPDGRLLLRDPGNARITAYSPGDEYLDSWELRGGYFTSYPLSLDTAGNVYTQIWGRNQDGDRYTALLPYAPDGTPGDSIMVPQWDYEEAAITFSTDQITAVNPVPFSPQPHWAFSPFGYFVGGLSDRYSIDVFRPDDSVLRIQRVVDPVPVQSAEREAEKMRITRSFQGVAPDWQWNGPPIPDAKPAFQDIAVGRDGRIWVRLHQPGFVAEEADPDDPRDVDQWDEPFVWDVFEPDGTYLGQVHGPDNFSSHPEPIFGRDHVWAVTTDELDVEYVTRFRIVMSSLETATE